MSGLPAYLRAHRVIISQHAEHDTPLFSDTVRTVDQLGTLLDERRSFFFRSVKNAKFYNQLSISYWQSETPCSQDR
jgi:hypothetical protein